MGIFDKNDHNRTKPIRLQIYLFTGTLLIIIVSIGIIIYNSVLVGHFRLSIDEYPQGNSSISISQDIDFKDEVAFLNVESSLNATGMTYNDINFEDFLQSEGQYIDPDQPYLAYSFYLKNTGTSMITIDYYMRFTDVVYWMQDYVRILVIEDDKIYRIYQKEDSEDEHGNQPIYEDMPPCIMFETDQLIFKDRIIDFKTQKVKLFRVIIWLEKQDPDLSLDYHMGLLNLNLTFNIKYNDEDMDSNYLNLAQRNHQLWIYNYQLCSVSFTVTHQREKDV